MTSLEERIAQAIEQILDRPEHDGFSAPDAERGMAIGGPTNPEIVLTVDQVARIAVRVVELDRTQSPPNASEAADALQARVRGRGTQKSDTWIESAFTESGEHIASADYVGIQRWLSEHVEPARDRSE